MADNRHEVFFRLPGERTYEKLGHIKANGIPRKSGPLTVIGGLLFTIDSVSGTHPKNKIIKVTAPPGKTRDEIKRALRQGW